MKKAEKATWIVEKLDEMYPDPPIPLDHHDAFTLLVAVMLSAQCTDAKVNTVTPILFRIAPNAQAMANTSVDQIRQVISSLGLAPTKARNLQAMAQLLIERHSGEVPSTFHELEALPGVGHKTASVVMSQSFGVPAFPVDTHIHRLSARWGLSDGTSVEKTEADLKKLFPRSAWNKLHLQMIYYGREYCTARQHDVEKCPICLECAVTIRKKSMSQ